MSIARSLRWTLAGAALAAGALAAGSAVRADSLTAFRIVRSDPCMVVFYLEAPPALDGTACMVKTDWGMPIGALTVHVGPNTLMAPQTGSVHYYAVGPGYSLRDGNADDNGIN